MITYIICRKKILRILYSGDNSMFRSLQRVEDVPSSIYECLVRQFYHAESGFYDSDHDNHEL